MTALFDTARLAIKARLEAAWTLTALDRIAWQNQPFGKPVDAQGNALAFLYVEVFNDDGVLLTIGAPGQRRVQQDGRIVAHAMVPFNTGLDLAGQFKGAVAGIFEEQTFDGVRCWISREEVGGTPDDTGAYFRTSVTIPFMYLRRV